jgi:hypothetical protein
MNYLIELINDSLSLYKLIGSTEIKLFDNELDLL